MRQIFSLLILICVITTAIEAQTSTAGAAPGAAAAETQDRVEQWRGKTVMVFTPHPDDDVFGCGGMLAMLARNGNKIIVVIYTNDNKGSFDLEMTSERLARIRKAEQEAAMDVIGIPKENIIWMGYEDVNLVAVARQ